LETPSRQAMLMSLSSTTVETTQILKDRLHKTKH